MGRHTRKLSEFHFFLLFAYGVFVCLLTVLFHSGTAKRNIPEKGKLINFNDNKWQMLNPQTIGYIIVPYLTWLAQLKEEDIVISF